MENNKAPTMKEFMDSLPNSKVDQMVKVKGTISDPNTVITKDRYESVREAWGSGKYKTKAEFCKELDISPGILEEILDSTEVVRTENNQTKRKWSKANKDHRKKYNQLPEVKARKKQTKEWRLENKRRIAAGLEPIKHKRKKPERRFNKDEE